MDYSESDTILNGSAEPLTKTPQESPATPYAAKPLMRPAEPFAAKPQAAPAEPVIVKAPEPVHAPVAAAPQPVPVSYAPTSVTPATVPSSYQVYPVRTQQPKKKRSAVGIVAIAVACAILGSILGGVVTGFMLKNNTSSSTVTQEKAKKPQISETPIPGDKQSTIKNVTPNDSSVELTPAEIYAAYVDSVVGITNEGTVTNIYGQITSSASCGSGFIISEDGYILSNYHVVESYEKLTVSLHNKEEYEAQLIGFDATNDVALLKINATGLTVAPLGDSDSIKVGDQVSAIGNPLGELDFSMTVGYISAMDREVNTDGNPINMMQTDAAINAGNSGGPLFDKHGNVIGITTAKYSGSTTTGASIEGIGFAIPINDVKSIVNDLEAYGYVTGKPYLGITVGDIDSAYMFYYDYPSSAYVNSVNPGSCADKAGLKKGDIITGIGDYMIKSYTDLVAALKNFKAGQETTLTVYRDGEKVVLNITLDERTPEATAQTVEETEPETETETEEPDSGFSWSWPFP